MNNRFQLIAAATLTATGAGLLIAGFIVSPTGEIHSSVLVAFGETMTFVGPSSASTTDTEATNDILL